VGKAKTTRIYTIRKGKKSKNGFLVILKFLMIIIKVKR
jgi:hypothetical protein